jgi:hypothetical protein
MLFRLLERRMASGRDAMFAPCALAERATAMSVSWVGCSRDNDRTVERERFAIGKASDQNADGVVATRDVGIGALNSEAAVGGRQ